MLLGVFAMTPLTASAAMYPPDPTETPAETIYVGGVALQMDQYVMNGSSTAVDGMPADDADGFAWYSEAGLLLVNYVYEGQGHLYDGDNKCDTCDYAMPAHDPDDPGTTPPADNPPNDDDGGLGAGAIVGIVIGSALVAGIGGFALFWFVIKKKSFADLIAVFKKK